MGKWLQNEGKECEFKEKKEEIVDVRRKRRGRRGFGLGKSVRRSEDEEELEDVRTQDMKE